MRTWSIEYRSLSTNNYIPGDDSVFEDADYFGEDMEAAIDAFVNARTKITLHDPLPAYILEASLVVCNETRDADGNLLNANFHAVAYAPAEIIPSENWKAKYRNSLKKMAFDELQEIGIAEAERNTHW